MANTSKPTEPVTITKTMSEMLTETKPAFTSLTKILKADYVNPYFEDLKNSIKGKNKTKDYDAFCLVALEFLKNHNNNVKNNVESITKSMTNWSGTLFNQSASVISENAFFAFIQALSIPVEYELPKKGNGKGKALNEDQNWLITNGVPLAIVKTFTDKQAAKAKKELEKTLPKETAK